MQLVFMTLANDHRHLTSADLRSMVKEAAVFGNRYILKLMKHVSNYTVF